jgi:spermidine/putrescine transport system ATP-binding protein
MVFQNYALFPHMTVGKNVAFGPERKRLPRPEIQKRVDQALETVRLSALVGRYPRQLSGGQQQRVALARALANRPALLLLDEPLGALDLKLREEMQLELKRIQREVGISFVYVTHDQGEALTMSDRIAVMAHGKIDQIGTPEEVYLRPSTLFVAGFIGQANLLPCIIQSMDRGRVRTKLEGGFSASGTAGGEGCAPMRPGVMVLRPQNLRIATTNPSGGEPGLPVTVVEEVFQGAVVRYQVQTAENAQLTVMTALNARLPAGSSGKLAFVNWDPAEALVLVNSEKEATAP